MTNDLLIVADRLRAEIMRPSRATDAAQGRDLMARQVKDGSWPDIDYADTSRTHWIPAGHLGRLLGYARIYRTRGGALEGSKQIRAAYVSGLRFWIGRDPQSENWWSNVIGAPRTLSDSLLLMGKEVPPDLIEASGRLIHRSGYTRTGANLVWEAGNLLTFACVTGDEDLLRDAVRHIGDEIRIATEEGIQHDDSFYQHGPQNYALGYGRSFALDVTRIAVALAGTSFAFPAEKIRILSRLILDGQQWFVHGRQIDYHAMGREAFRGRPRVHSDNAPTLSDVCANMEASDPARAPEYAAFAARIAGAQAPGQSGPLGNKHFWRSDTMVHRAPQWYASVRFHSTRTYAVETRVNRENLKGYHLSDGVCFLMRRGDEYHDLQPVWDYRKLPGLTFLDTEAPIPYGSDTPRGGNTAFVGGVSDGLSGAAVMDYGKGGVRAKRSWFFTDRGIVCLGAGISSSEPEDVLTTLNQCALKSEVTLLRQGRPSPLVGGRLEALDVDAVHHDGVVYALLEGAATVVRAQRQTGSWREVEDRASDESLSEDVFTCWINHGARPAGASFAYRIVPGASPDAMAALVSGKDVQVLSNSPDLQAVHDAAESLTMAVFHTPGALEASGASRLATDTPCALQLRNMGDLLLLSVADPTQACSQLTLTLRGRFTGHGAAILPEDGTTRIVVPLPGGPWAGQSILIPLRGR